MEEKHHQNNVNAIDASGWTPLHHLAKDEAEGNLTSAQITDKVTVLLSQGANPHIQNTDGNTPFNIAAPASPITGRLMTMHWLEQALNGSAVDLNYQSGRLSSSLAQYIAKWSADNEIGKQLDAIMEKGGNIAIKSFDGWGPLHSAAAMGRLKAVEELSKRYTKEQLDMKTTSEYTTTYGKSQVIYPAGSTAKDIAQIRLQNDKSISAVMKLGLANIVDGFMKGIAKTRGL